MARSRAGLAPPPASPPNLQPLPLTPSLRQGRVTCSPLEGTLTLHQPVFNLRVCVRVCVRRCCLQNPEPQGCSQILPT